MISSYFKRPIRRTVIARTEMELYVLVEGRLPQGPDRRPELREPDPQGPHGQPAHGRRGGRSNRDQVFTSRDSPRTICRVMVAKWVCMMHFQANWKR